MKILAIGGSGGMGRLAVNAALSTRFESSGCSELVLTY